MKTLAPAPPANRLFRAFSDPTRRRILQLLRKGELCVGDLVEILRVPQAKASRHLAYLRKVGLTASREKGLWCFYSLAPARSALHRKLLESLDGCAEGMREFEDDARRAAEVRMGGGCCPLHARERGEWKR